MFTGIIEEMGTVHKLDQKKNLVVLSIKAKKVCPGTKPGSSICVDGVCLTVCTIKNKMITFDVMYETLDKTSLGSLRPGSKVNLERALKLNSRLDGHIVSGHVDQISHFQKQIKKENYLELRFSLNQTIARFVVPKGSIAINGVSLTVGVVRKKYFSVYIIPTTEKETNLGVLEIHQPVNIEVDLLARYIEKQLIQRK